MMTSYEAFFTIILRRLSSSQIPRTVRRSCLASKISFRQSPEHQYLLRQDHNGFSHQSPMLISSASSSRPGKHVTCFFPVDATAVDPCFNYLLESKNQVNLVTFNKTDEPVWQDEEAAKKNFEQGCSLFEFISNKKPGRQFRLPLCICRRYCHS